MSQATPPSGPTPFADATLEQWKKAAAKSAPGGNVESLNWVTPEGITVKPLYTAADTARAGDERIQHLGFRPDSTLRPTITSIATGPAGASVSFTTLPGKPYRLEAQDVLGGAWQPGGESVLGDGTVRQLGDATPGQPGRFYRVRVP